MSNNLLNLRIGIIGGGQLGKMMILAGKELGFHFTTLDPNKNCPSSSISDELIVAQFNDKNAICLLANSTDILTYEFEHINCDILLELENQGYKIYPTAKSLKSIQSKLSQKEILQKNNIPIADFCPITAYSESDYFDKINQIGISFGYPFILKTSTGGYDGKGNFLIKSDKDISKALKELGGGTLPLLAEKFIDFQCEISVLACRDTKGNVVIYPVGCNHHINNILHKTVVPANLSNELIKKALGLSEKIMNIFDGVGMFCIEMFVTKDNFILINEVAPRPHNSGHYTIEACYTSQFQNHIRAITSLPLGNANLINPAVMVNLIGEDDSFGKTKVKGLYKALSIPGISIHIYGKETVSPSRKMGHLTSINKDINMAELNALEAFKSLSINS